MSTDHPLIDKASGPLVSVLERSGEFTLEVDFKADEQSLTLCELSAPDLVKIARNLIQIAAYNVEDGEALLREFNMDYARDSLVVR